MKFEALSLSLLLDLESCALSPIRTDFNANRQSEQTLTKQLHALRPEHKQKIANPRNPPLWELNPELYTNPETWSRPPRFTPKLPPRVFPISVLNALVVRHYRATHRVPLGIRGRYWPLLYLLLATLISPPNNNCVLVVDCDGDFEVSRILESTPISMRPLPPHRQPKDIPQEQHDRVHPPYHRDVLPSDLTHVYVIRPADRREGPLCRAILQAKQYMMYGPHRSRDREFWGTILIGADSPEAEVDVVCGTMKCWLKVERQFVPDLWRRGVKSYQGGLQRKDEHETERAFTPLIARCIWGRFKFDDKGLIFPGKPRQANVRVGGSRVRVRRKTPPPLRPAPWIITRSAYRATHLRRRIEASELGEKSRAKSDSVMVSERGVV